MKLKLLFFTLCTAVIFTSCKQDPCKDVNCLHGVCNEGVCICESGWEGEFCTIAEVDPCDNVVCVNGQCTNGNCLCDAGYEGTDCGTAYNAKFAGNYSITEVCNSGSDSYTISISSSSSSPYDLILTGLWAEPGATALATIYPNGSSFSISYQIYSNSVGSIAGLGYINPNATVVTIIYDIFNTNTNTPFDQCTMTATKQ